MCCNSLDEQTILLSLFGNRALYLISQDGGAVGFVDFTKLSFALSSLVQQCSRYSPRVLTCRMANVPYTASKI